jgi:hypothetical protein
MIAASAIQTSLFSGKKTAIFLTLIGNKARFRCARWPVYQIVIRSVAGSE